jgi:cytochrome c556
MRTCSRIGVTLLFLVGGAVLLAADEKPTPVKAIMKKVHAKGGLLAKIEKAAKGDKPDWDDIQKLTADYAKTVADMPKNPAPVPTKKDLWKELTEKLAKSGKKMDEQAKKREFVARGVQDAATNIRGQCRNCHENFRRD